MSHFLANPTTQPGACPAGGGGEDTPVPKALTEVWAGEGGGYQLLITSLQLPPTWSPLSWQCPLPTKAPGISRRPWRESTGRQTQGRSPLPLSPARRRHSFP